MIDKAFSEFDETYFNKMLEDNSVYFDQRLKKLLRQKNFGLLKEPINIIHNYFNWI